MNEVNVQVHQERLRDLVRDADNERLVRESRVPRNQLLRNARQAVGNGLVSVGNSLLDER